jgi:hypothetical protein
MFFIEAKHSIPMESFSNLSTFQKWLNMDWVGTFICLAMVTSLLLPLQWGGNTKAWKDKDVIALFCVVSLVSPDPNVTRILTRFPMQFGVLLISWLLWEWYKGDRAILPLFMMKRRTQVGTCLEAVRIFLSNSRVDADSAMTVLPHASAPFGIVLSPIILSG